MKPDKSEALELLRISGCSERVLKHCLTVADHAKEIAQNIQCNGYQVDVELVFIGALLHDIGRSVTYDIQHAVEGARLGKEYGLHPAIIRIIETHIGAGIPETEALTFGLPPGNYMPTTLEEKIVAHADNMVDDDHVVSITEEVDALRKKGMHESIIERTIKLGSYIDEMMG
ncbi:MAG: TIGR00295 family protein [ANME-2 cluster archaeon]|nr:TIGR00295 family protein [ANME-2 cluster archaeon]